MNKIILTCLISLYGFSARADFPAITPGSPQEAVANVANSIFSVTLLKVGVYAYQIVSMDSKLNGDVSLTTIVLVGQYEVGGEAGYEASFQLTPNSELNSLISAKVDGTEIALTFGKMDGKQVTKKMHYDAKSRLLIESAN